METTSDRDCYNLATSVVDLNHSASTIGAMLGHAGRTITSGYVHDLDAVLIATADRIAG